MNYARTENWIRNFTNPLKNWRRHAKPGPFEAAWNRGIEHEIAGTSWTITTAHTILGFNVSTSFRLLDPQQELTRYNFSEASLIWTIYSFSCLTWLTARYEKQPVVTVKNTFFTISLAAATQSFSILSPIFWSKTVRNVLALANVNVWEEMEKDKEPGVSQKNIAQGISQRFGWCWLAFFCTFGKIRRNCISMDFKIRIVRSLFSFLQNLHLMLRQFILVRINT